jgi:hypothetical protein
MKGAGPLVTAPSRNDANIHIGQDVNIECILENLNITVNLHRCIHTYRGTYSPGSILYITSPPRNSKIAQIPTTGSHNTFP